VDTFVTVEQRHFQLLYLVPIIRGGRRESGRDKVLALVGGKGGGEFEEIRDELVDK